MTLPTHRSARDGRTFAQSYGPDYGIAIWQFQRRTTWADRAWWIASALLICASLALVFG